jgi:hypothetical protein
VKRTILALVVFSSLVSRSNAELFSSSTNFIQTLTVATNEAVFFSGIAFAPYANSVPNCKATVLQYGRARDVIFADVNSGDGIHYGRVMRGITGPLQLQFPNSNVHLEFQRVQLTNMVTVFTDGSNSVAISIPSGRSIKFIEVQSFVANVNSGSLATTAYLTLSNSVTTASRLIVGGEVFSGPSTAYICAGSEYGSSPFGAMVTYCLTEEFAAIPAVGAIQVPAGQSQIQVEKSDDLQNWRSVMINQVSSDTRGFYRIKATK